MKLILNLYNNVLKKPSLYLFVVLTIFSIDRHHRLEFTSDTKLGPFYSDVKEYYSFLPDFFLNDEKTLDSNFETNKRTIGLALLYTPFFFFGDAVAIISDAPRNGYSQPYQWSIRWGSIIYTLLGLFLCRSSLLLFFKEPIVFLSLLCVFFGTNLFFYTYSIGEMPHSYLFCLYAAFIYLVLNYLLENKSRYLLWASFLAGLITLIRPTAILVLLFPLLFDVHNLKDVKVRFTLLVSKPFVLAACVFLFLFPLIVQACIWKKYVGSYFHYSYGQEGFFFNDPQVFNFLFSFRKGWLVYTPMMVFALLGIILLRKHLRSFFVFSLVFITATVYVLSSWWDWAYGGSFGCRAMIEVYAFLLFPFATFLNRFWVLAVSKPVINAFLRTGLLGVLFFISYLNIFQSHQYRHHIIHWSGMTKDAYCYVFLKEGFNAADRMYLETLFKLPNTQQLLKGQRDE